MEEALRDLTVEEDSVEECFICLYEIEDDGDQGNSSLKTLECGHTFHGDCVATCVQCCEEKKLGLTCPYCRQELKVQDVFPC